MSCLERHSQTLRQRGYRMTPQRISILQALHAGGHLAPTQVYERVRQTGLTETTVYRTLDFLARNDILFSSHDRDGHLTYELAGSAHHHLVCRLCGAQVGLEPEVLSGLFAQLESRTAYQINAGHLTFFGLCPACQEHSV